MSEATYSSTVAWYDREAARLAPIYASRPSLSSREWVADLLPAPPGLVLDIGAGTGRHAVAFASIGYEVIAVEPSAGMRAQVKREATADRVRWISDFLPDLASISRLGVAADVVCLNAVWQHVLPADRPRAFRKAVGLLRSSGRDRSSSYGVGRTFLTTRSGLTRAC